MYVLEPSKAAAVDVSRNQDKHENVHDVFCHVCSTVLSEIARTPFPVLDRSGLTIFLKDRVSQFTLKSQRTQVGFRLGRSFAQHRSVLTQGIAYVLIEMSSPSIIILVNFHSHAVSSGACDSHESSFTCSGSNPIRGVKWGEEKNIWRPKQIFLTPTLIGTKIQLHYL